MKTRDVRWSEDSGELVAWNMKTRSWDPLPDRNYISVLLTPGEAQSLYDHMGTMPYCRDSWANGVLAALSEALHYAARRDAACTTTRISGAVTRSSRRRYTPSLTQVKKGKWTLRQLGYERAPRSGASESVSED